MKIVFDLLNLCLRNKANKQMRMRKIIILFSERSTERLIGFLNFLEGFFFDSLDEMEAPGILQFLNF
jgi:hypothetical protein